MLIKSVMKRLGPILFISSLNLSAYADILNEQKPVFLLGTENEIVKAAQGNGLESSDISITWHETSSDGYNASVRCLNSIKCNRCLLKIELGINHLIVRNGLLRGQCLPILLLVSSTWWAIHINTPILSH